MCVRVCRQVSDVKFTGDDILINSAAGLIKLQLVGATVKVTQDVADAQPVIFNGTSEWWEANGTA